MKVKDNIAEYREIGSTVRSQKLPSGYKKTDIGVYPEDWDVATLGAVTQIVSGGTPKTGIRKYWNGEVQWCTPTDITRTKSKYIRETERQISNLGLNNSSATLLPKGALLLCSRATIGDVKIAEVEMCTNQGFKSLVCKNDIYNEFLYYEILTMKPQMIEKAIGSTFLEISKKETEQLMIPLPTLPEQRAIANVLSDTDALITSLEKLIEKKKLIKQGTMQELLTGKRRLKGFEDKWEKKNLGSICNKITTGKLDANAMKTDGDYRFYTCAKTFYYIDKYAFDDEALLISGNGENVGYVHYYKGKFNAYQRTYVLTGFSSNIHFVKLYLDMYLGKRIATEVNAGNTPYIKMGTLTEMEIFIPNSYSEQSAIACIITDMDSEIESLEKKLSKYRDIKQGMMQTLLTGKIRLVSGKK